MAPKFLLADGDEIMRDYRQQLRRPGTRANTRNSEKVVSEFDPTETGFWR